MILQPMFGINGEDAAVRAHQESRRVVVVVRAILPIGEVVVQDCQTFSPAGKIVTHHLDIPSAGRIVNACRH